MFTYPVILTPDGETLMVTFPDFPEAITSGADEADALAMAADCLEEVVAARIRDREEIPQPSRPTPGQRMVVLATNTALKALVYDAMRADGVRKADLARRLGWTQRQVDRLLDPRNMSRPDTIDVALRALGRRLEVSLAPIPRQAAE